MQTKYFVFLALLAFCHVSYCDTEVTAGSNAAPDVAQQMLQQFQQGLTTAMDTIRTSLGKAFSVDAVLNITNSIVKSSSLNAQQVQGIVQQTIQKLQENLKSIVDNAPAKVSDFKLSQVGDAVVQTAQIFPDAVKNVFSFLENVSHGANNPATTAPVKT